jgi:UDP-glucose 4-epimerase
MLTHLNLQPIKPARVVVIGAHGFVGNAIATRLERDGVPVQRLTRAQVDLLSADAADRLASLLRPDDALVAVAAVAPCKNAAMLRDNVSLALALTRTVGITPVAHLVNISSDAVYADEPVPLHEASPMAPDTLHGVMHLARELMFRAETKGPFATVRPSLIYGAGDPHNGYGPNRFRRLAAKNEPIVLFGEGEEQRDHVLIDDVAELATRVLYRRSTGALNVATGDVASFRDVATLAVRLSGRDVPIKGSPRQGPMPHNGYRPFDIAACRAAFPDFAYTSLAQGMAKAQREEAT